MLDLWPVPSAAAAPVALRDGDGVLVAAEPVEVVAASGTAALEALDSLTPGWWAGYLGYDLGRAVEPIRERWCPEPALPDLLLARYDARARIGPRGVQTVGTVAARRRLDRLLEAAGGPPPLGPLGAATSSLCRAAYEAGVRAVLELIAAGDCYQVNLTRRLSWSGAADPLALGAAVRAASPAPWESLLVLPAPGGGTVSVVSASPEQFLVWDRDRLETRPIKGTDTDPGRLRASAKDRAENVMIVDLARNDLGRCCEFGSVQVSALCALESHPGLYHLVSTVRGRRRPGRGPGAMVRATFPPASVTGAPKPRVLQAIEDLEVGRRGVYCGAIGWIDTERDAGALAVAIRTFWSAAGATHLGTGAGIVADSVPAREWAETELKVSRLVTLLDR